MRSAAKVRGRRIAAHVLVAQPRDTRDRERGDGAREAAQRAALCRPICWIVLVCLGRIVLLDRSLAKPVHVQYGPFEIHR